MHQYTQPKRHLTILTLLNGSFFLVVPKLPTVQIRSIWILEACLPPPPPAFSSPASCHTGYDRWRALSHRSYWPTGSNGRSPVV